MVSIQLINHLELNNLLYHHQYGFQPKKTKEHNLTHLSNYIFNALNEKKYCIGLFLDFKKAFDVCPYSIHLKKLKKYGINGNTHEWFKSYLSDRIQKVDINGNLSSEKVFNISVIQGSILGPILFLIYINDLYTCSELLTLMFADDTAGLASHTNIDVLTTFVNAELKKIAEWFRINKMAVNVNKTKFMIFHTKGKIIPLNSAKIFYDDNETGKNNPNLVYEIERYHSNHENNECRAYKLLGIYLDENFTLNKHIDILSGKLSKSLYCINKVKNFLSKKALITLYYALFHSHLTYCPNIISCTSSSNINRILKLQKKAIRIITFNNYNAHTNPIFKELNLLPYDKLLTYSKLMFMHSVHYNYCPSSFNNSWQLNLVQNNEHNLRNQNDYSLTFPRIEQFKKSPLYSLPFLWNSLDDIKLQRNRTTF
jgi:hypothetical protein